MVKKMVHFTNGNAREITEDIRNLGLIYPLKKLHYSDIARQEQLQKMMHRWPLLAELAQYTQMMQK